MVFMGFPGSWGSLQEPGTQENSRNIRVLAFSGRSNDLKMGHRGFQGLPEGSKHEKIKVFVGGGLKQTRKRKVLALPVGFVIVPELPRGVKTQSKQRFS